MKSDDLHVTPWRLLGGRTSSNGRPRANIHPTVKLVALMQWLCRLITPPGGAVLDPFTGSGSTAAIAEGFHFIGIEREAEYLAIAQVRLAHAAQQNHIDLVDNDAE